MIEMEFEVINLEIDDDYIQDQLDAFGLRTRDRIRQEMRRTKRGGRVYRRGGRRHVASSPGSFPAIDTGRLSQSIDYDAGKDQLRVGAGIEYAGYVDATRPYLEPGVDKTYADWPQFMNDFLKVE